MTHLQARRASDNSFFGTLGQILINGDIGMVLLLGGAGLLLWAGFGYFSFHDDVEAYARMFPLGNVEFWLWNYVFCGLGLWYLAGSNLPAVPSLMVGIWVSTLWCWSAFARMTAVSTVQTGNATSVIYIIIGLLAIHRSARK